MDNKITVRVEEQKDRRRDRRPDLKEDSQRGSPSPPSKMVILAKKPEQRSGITLLTKSGNDSFGPKSPSSSSGAVSTPPVQIIQPNKQQTSSTGSTSTSHTSDEMMIETRTNMPKVMKLIDGDSLTFLESPASDFLLSDSPSSGRFSVITAVGLQNVGKSSLLNRIAGKEVFKTHKNSERRNFLKHVTKGVDLHVTKERLLLLDTQPLLSASVLDDLLALGPSTTSSLISNVSEPENMAFLSSLQLLAFLIMTCDYIIVVNDWMVDVHLMKLVTTAVMMVGDSAQKANIICYFNQTNVDFNVNSIELLLGRGLSFTVITGNENELITSVMKFPSNRLIGDNGGSRNSLHVSEKSWLNTSKSYWENSICKSTLFSDYAHFLP